VTRLGNTMDEEFVFFVFFFVFFWVGGGGEKKNYPICTCLIRSAVLVFLLVLRTFKYLVEILPPGHIQRIRLPNSRGRHSFSRKRAITPRGRIEEFTFIKFVL